MGQLLPLMKFVRRSQALDVDGTGKATKIPGLYGPSYTTTDVVQREIAHIITSLDQGVAFPSYIDLACDRASALLNT